MRAYPIFRNISLIVSILAVAAVALLCPSRGDAGVVTLHDFNPMGDGQSPMGSLVQGTDGDFYGVTSGGGTGGCGTIFKITSAGTITLLHSFVGPDGSGPFQSLVQGVDGNFYGITEFGGAFNWGTVFKITPNGVFTCLHSFHNSSDGAGPCILLQGIDGNFYGTTNLGGANFFGGTIFKITPSGTLTTLYSFGGVPYSYYGAESLMQGIDGNFYGTTSNDGITACGTIFKITPAGAFTTIHTFTGNWPGTGANPTGGLIQGTDGDFYGLTYYTGRYNTGYGTVYKITPTGTLTTLHTFANSDGASPYTLMQASDGNFYGTTCFGGASGYGTIFEIAPSGTLTTLYSFSSRNSLPIAPMIQGIDGNFYYAAAGGAPAHGGVFSVTPNGNLTLLHSFVGPPTDGDSPDGGLIQGRDGSFYGTTIKGGTAQWGTVYKVNSSGVLNILHSFAFADGWRVTSPLVRGVDGNYYGATAYGGVYGKFFGNGTLFQLNPGGTVAIVHSFTDQDGANPTSLIESTDGNLYGTTQYSPAPSGQGTFFQFSLTGNLTTVHSFSSAAVLYPFGIVEANDGNFYGLMAGSAFAGGYGAAFQITPGGTVTTLHSFASQEDLAPVGSLIQGADGNLYGVTAPGGSSTASNDGTVYAMGLDGSLTTLYSFTGLDGSRPNSGLIEGSNGDYYGTTLTGGALGFGTVFEITPSGSLTTLHSFNGTDGSWPAASLLQSIDGCYYGTTSSGGAGGIGTIFQITPHGRLTTLYSFSGHDGHGSNNPLVQDASGILYGSGDQGGAYGFGSIFALHTYVVTPSAGVGGTVSPSTSQTVGSGNDLPLTAIPRAGYAVQWLLDGLLVQDGGLTYVLSNITANHNVSASFAIPTAPPTTPAHLSATAANAKVTLSWTASARATSYSVYRGTTQFGQSSTPIVNGLTDVTYIDAGLTNGMTYFYRVAAFNSVGNSPEGNQAAGTPVAPPAVPTSLTASAGNGRATLTWTASAGATSYNVYRGTSSYGQSATPIVAGVVGTTYVNTGLTNGTTYYYRVAAFNAVGNSAEGNQAIATPVAPPPVPTNLTATAGNAKVTLAWTASPSATSYSVYRGTTSFGQSPTPVATGVTGTTYVDAGLTNGVAYYYRIAAFNAGGNSPEGNQASATPVAPPAVPTNLTATSANGSVTLTWTASAGATSYNVYRGTSSFGQSASPIASGVPSTTYVDSAVTAGTTYYYRVAAFNAGGNSAEGNQASATP